MPATDVATHQPLQLTDLSKSAQNTFLSEQHASADSNASATNLLSYQHVLQACYFLYGCSESTVEPFLI